ncbi:MAG: patatin-like phospholipase family protein [Bryobacteraceae bacterium]
MSGLHQLRSRRVGLALSGGSVRGLAHIGVVKLLSEAAIRPAVITGTSAGSLIGAMLAAGMEWSETASLARKTFWPKLLHGETLERFCAEHLPGTFADLKLPFAVTTTELPEKRSVIIAKGELASAISASCALRGIRRPVRREGKRLKDGGIACVLPSEACRTMGADFIIGSDVWEISSLLRGFGIDPHHPRASRTYPAHYNSAVRSTDLLVYPRVPLAGYVPGPLAIERMISAGEDATRLALSRFTSLAA